MPRVEGKVALVTGAARGQGRSHAVRLAQEGADIIAVDLCRDVATAPYAMPSIEDLEETVAQVQALGRTAVACQADARQPEELSAAVRAGLAVCGRLDFAVVNHGISSIATAADMSPATWGEMIDINLTGAWNVCQAVIGQLVKQQAGVIVLTSSVLGLRGARGSVHYSAAKHGVVGIMRSLANELGPHGIRVNSVNPTQVETPMIMHQAIYDCFAPHLEHPTVEDFLEASLALHSLPVAIVQPGDVSNAVLFLCSDEARYITGVALPIDAGNLAR